MHTRTEAPSLHNMEVGGRLFQKPGRGHIYRIIELQSWKGPEDHLVPFRYFSCIGAEYLPEVSMWLRDCLNVTSIWNVRVNYMSLSHRISISWII